MGRHLCIAAIAVSALATCSPVPPYRLGMLRIHTKLFSVGASLGAAKDWDESRGRLAGAVFAFESWRFDAIAARDDPVHLFAGTCKMDQHEPTRDVALYSWKLQPTHMWCRPFAERQVIWVDFDKKRRVNAITSMCPEMII